MQVIFEGLTQLKGVEGVFFVKADGRSIFQWTAPDAAGSISQASWGALTRTFPDVQEVELLYEKRRVYILRGEEGLVVVVMDRSAPAAGMRLDCKIAIAKVRQKVTAS
jgi:hypothetical protein